MFHPRSVNISKVSSIFVSIKRGLFSSNLLFQHFSWVWIPFPTRGFIPSVLGSEWLAHSLFVKICLPLSRSTGSKSTLYVTTHLMARQTPLPGFRKGNDKSRKLWQVFILRPLHILFSWLTMLMESSVFSSFNPPWIYALEPVMKGISIRHTPNNNSLWAEEDERRGVMPGEIGPVFQQSLQGDSNNTTVKQTNSISRVIFWKKFYNLPLNGWAERQLQHSPKACETKPYSMPDAPICKLHMHWLPCRFVVG